MSELPAGHAVGPYEILAPLGRGGMGTVYLARDRRLGRQVALKFLHADDGEHDAYSRVLREARAASTLNHPNICQVYDVGSEGAASWIAMEYIEGQPLSAILASRTIPHHEAVRIVQALAGGLAHAHARGVIHRDLKPANVVFDSGGQPKILDFGISSRSPEAIASDVTQTGAHSPGSSFEGSLPYMAPELLRGELPDQRSDLWSLGVLFYELLTGRLPFQGSTIDVMAAILEARVPALPSSVPPHIVHVVKRLLAKAPSERFGSATEAAAALDAMVIEAPVRRRYGRVLVGSALTVALATAGYAIWAQRRSKALSLADQLLVSVSDTPHRAPTFSPDATLVAVIVPDDAGVAQVRVVDPAQKQSIPVTSGPAAASRPRWSPKGDQIVYAVDGQGIWSVSPVGGEARRIVESGFNPNFSRDGTRLVFEKRDGLWTAGADGSNPQRVQGSTPLPYPMARGPAFSPDGREIAFFQTEAGPNGDLWAISSTGGTPRRLTSDLREGGWPVWTRDGRSIIYSSARAGSRTLWQVSATGGSPVPLTVGAGEDDEPELSADGVRLAYSNVRNTWDLRTRDLTTGTERSLLRRNTELVFPQFSPDGTRIVFFGRADYGVAIFTVNVDGTGLRQLTGGRALNHQPRWSHDGEQIYFFQVNPERAFLRMSALGGGSTTFRQWEWTTANAPQFDPTGRFVAYLRARPPGAPSSISEHTVIHTIATGEERVWDEPHTHPSGWSKDGGSIAGWQHPGSVVICTVADGQCRKVTTGVGPAWPLGSDRLYFLRPADPSKPQELWSIGVNEGDERFEAAVGLFRPIDRVITVSPNHVAAWANLQPGRYEVWTATIR